MAAESSAADSRTAHSSKAAREITILGAGPAGTLLAILLAQRGCRIHVFERLSDLRAGITSSGRSINLALAARGIEALQQAGVFESVRAQLIPMRGRMLHDEQGKQTLLPYGADPREVIYSISRTALNAALLDFAARQPNIQLNFQQACIGVDAIRLEMSLQDLPTGRLYSRPLDRVVGADGAGSLLRRFLAEHAGIQCTEDLLPHGYKELTIAAGKQGAYRLDPHALHVWPRGNFMLIALPNPGGNFTATLFLPYEGAASFAALAQPAAVTAFFRQHFPDVPALVPDLIEQFNAHPTGVMGTVRCVHWSLEERLVLIGDAAHAIVPFHGQGMNCAFEDCVEFAALLDRHGDWRATCAEFERTRRPNTDAIADMALENYIEMRDTVRNPKFQLQKELSLKLERRFPGRFIPRYSMVMFHPDIPYAEARSRGAIQAQILAELTHSARTLADVDFQHAERLIAQRLSDPVAGR